MNTSSRRLAATLLAATGCVALAVGGASSLWPPSAAAQGEAARAIPLGPPACTCSSPVETALHPLQNCTCGGLQCVVAGAKPPGTPAIVCVR